ncbi:MAG: bifunctional DNA-formamidopyrimidine glycosylase/DNA-(apurinic or apyrimidinic site) lyase [Pseudomonadota bacterium]
MPELPEVETVKRGLAPVMEGRRLVRVTANRPDLRFPLPQNFAERLTGQTVLQLNRRAKFVLVHLDGGDVLIMHLGMSGRFTIDAGNGARRPGQFVHDVGGISAHDHIVFEIAGGARVTYNDPRRFGYMDLVPSAELDACKHVRDLGVEPIGNAFHADYLARKAAGRKQDLKAFLLDQRVIAGLGNIYVCEALSRAGLSPRRRAGTLADKRGRPTERCQRLVPVIRTVIAEAIASGGSSLRDYAHADGSLGYFQHTFHVYGREGEPCRSGCGSTVKRIVQGGRSTFFCSTCQR